MAGNSQRRGATKKQSTPAGSGGRVRRGLEGKGPTPKAEDRVYHKAYKAKKQAEKRQRSDPRLAARRRAAHFTSNSDDLVIGRNSVLEALRAKIPATAFYIAQRVEMDDRVKEMLAVNTRSNKEDNTAAMRLTIEIPGLDRLGRLLGRLAQLPNIIEARRNRHNG